MKISTGPIIHEFLEEFRFAFIGVSRDPKHFSRSLFAEFLKHGYEPIPINTRADEIDGRKCYANISGVAPPVKEALVLTTPEQVLPAVKTCREAGVMTLWLYGIMGPKGLEPAVLDYCHTQEMRVVDGYCPFMFLPQSSFFHKFHGFTLRMMGRYPV